jgi:hypothetical protein
VTETSQAAITRVGLGSFCQEPSDHLRRTAKQLLTFSWDFKVNCSQFHGTEVLPLLVLPMPVPLTPVGFEMHLRAGWHFSYSEKDFPLVSGKITFIM